MDAESLPTAPILEELAPLRHLCREWRDAGLRLVTTNGCFDILHAGHIQTLRLAGRLGDRLIVALNSDRSVRELKGAARPVVPQDQRAATLAALPFVDLVFIFDEATPERVLSAVRPAIHAKGADYEVADLAEAETVHSQGGQIVILPLIPDVHTSRIIREYESRQR